MLPIPFLIYLTLIIALSFLSIATCLPSHARWYDRFQLVRRIFPIVAVIMTAIAKTAFLLCYIEEPKIPITSSLLSCTLAILVIFLCITAETLIIIPMLRLTIFRRSHKAPGFPQKVFSPKFSTKPKVAILILCADETPSTLKRSIESATKVSYSEKIVCLIENSVYGSNKRDAYNLASEMGLRVVSVPNTGSKGDAINQALKKVPDSDYIFLVDADQKLSPRAISAAVDLICRKPDVCMVVSPQSYMKDMTNPIASAAQFQIDCYAQAIMPAMGQSSCTIMVGTNCLISRKVLEKVGGFDTTTNTEDYATSLILHLAGQQSELLYRKLGNGLAPSSFHSFCVQQARWAQGGTMVLKQVIRNLILNPGRLSLWQWLHYLLATTHYTFSLGLSFFVFLAVGQCFAGYSVASRIRFLFPSSGYLLAAASLCGVVLYLAACIVLLRIAGDKRRGDFWRAGILAIVMTPVYCAACVTGFLLRRAPHFQVTRRPLKQSRFILLYVIPQIFVVILCFSAGWIGIYNIIKGMGAQSTLAICTFWSGWITVLYVTGLYMVFCSKPSRAELMKRNRRKKSPVL